MAWNLEYRPRSLNEMVGSLSVRTSIATLLAKNTLPNAVIINGDNGLGKTTLSYIIAHSLMCGCEEDSCEVKRQLWGREELSTVTNVYEIDLGKNRDEDFVDNVVDLLRIKGKKVLILDEIQNLSNINMTKFLKSMDNCDSETFLVICTTELHKLDTGIVSRSETFTLNPPSITEMATHLELLCRMMERPYERDGLMLIAKSKYKVRDAIRSLETILDIYGDTSVQSVRTYLGKHGIENQLKYLDACSNKSPYDMLFLLDEISHSEGIYKFAESFKEFLLNAVYIKNGIKVPTYLDEEISKIYQAVRFFSIEELSELLYRLEKMPQKSNIDKQIWFINLGNLISNGKLLDKTGNTLEIRKSAKQAFDSFDLEEKSIGGGTKAFSIEGSASDPGELGQMDEEIKIDGFGQSILGKDELDQISSIFSSKGGEAIEE